MAAAWQAGSSDLAGALPPGDRAAAEPGEPRPWAPWGILAGLALGIVGIAFAGGRASRPSALAKMPPEIEPFAHRGYLVKPNPFDRRWYISRGGAHVGSAGSPEAARAEIDLLAG
jgi:hypothetical protein